MNKIKENSFGGKDTEQYNALMQAFKDCAKDGDDKELYSWLEDIPKTSMVVFLVDKLHELGYDIKRTHYPLI